jgi:hypothetical protein
MWLKNNKARLITINGKFDNGVRVEKFQVKPGNNPAVEVPDELCETAFVKTLIEDGVLSVVAAPAEDGNDTENDVDQYKGMSRSDLQGLCTAQGIEFKSGDNRGELIAKLTEFDKEQK